jgi:hypothetical protein
MISDFKPSNASRHVMVGRMRGKVQRDSFFFEFFRSHNSQALRRIGIWFFRKDRRKEMSQIFPGSGEKKR